MKLIKIMHWIGVVFLLLLFCSSDLYGQNTETVSGRVFDAQSGETLPGVNFLVKGTTIGASTDENGNYELTVPSLQDTLVASYIGYQTQEVPINGRTQIDIQLTPQAIEGEEVVVVGYGTQEKSDITGSVASVSEDRLEMVPNINLADALQGATPGVLMRTTGAGAAPSDGNQQIMVRGRNSIRAGNEPLIVVDGIPYNGDLGHLNPNDVQSIEVLKDASAAAIYGSRGANGVILVTTKEGGEGEPKIDYDGYYSIQRLTNIPDLMNGEEFYQFKMERNPDAVTPSEQQIFESGEWVDWLDLALRNGLRTEHNLSVSGGTNNTQYYVSGGFTDVRGLAVNDDYQRLSARINIDTEVADWITIGTKSEFMHDDRSGLSPTWGGDHGVFWFNPLTRAYDENGELSIYPWEEDPYFRNPLMSTLAEDVDENYQIISNNYGIIDFPFLSGLQYRINAGIRTRYLDRATYYGRDTQEGLVDRGDAYTNRVDWRNTVIENILSYQQDFGRHSLFLTGVYSYEENSSSSNELDATGFPHDFLTWYAAQQAESVVPDYSYSSTTLISQMARLNYSFDNRYLLTITGRRDGYSGFGVESKWGNFPSAAVGWNLANEAFFPWKDLINQLKLRVSWGLNGNQAVGSYETISRLGQNNVVAASNTLPGYVPSQLGEDNLGWESTETLNLGLDFSILSDRISGDINVYRANTSDLLLNRSISPVHGITSITQNIGETQNRGIEISLTSRNISTQHFTWTTSGNLSSNKNEIVSLYGELDEEGNEIDDVANRWFIDEPISVIYNHVWGGVWQQDEAEEAALYGSQPGFVKIKDFDADTTITADDRRIIGQQDPKFLWGMSNEVSYKNLTLRVFVHGVHGVTKRNPLMTDEVDEGVRFTTVKKNWWTPEDPTNDWVMNHLDAEDMDGNSAPIYEDASFIRVKDVTLSYNLPRELLNNLGLNRLQLYVTGRNLFTFTDFSGLDPELSGQTATPLQHEYVFGVNLGF